MKKRLTILVVIVVLMLNVHSEKAAGASAGLSKSGMSPSAVSSRQAVHPQGGEVALIISLAASLVVVDIAALGFAVASSFRRSLSFERANEWEDPRYLSELPNVLGLLSQREFETIWPRRCNPWSMRRFERRLLRVIYTHLRQQAAGFVDRHMSVWTWVESHRPECQRLLRARKAERALECLALPQGPQKKAGLLAFLKASARQSTSVVIIDDETKRQLQMLGKLQVVMREHGYCVSAEFHQRDELDETPPEHLAEALVGNSQN
jgi:hypothetical protein